MSRQRILHLLLCGAFALPVWAAVSPPIPARNVAGATSAPLQLYAHLQMRDRQLQPLDGGTLKSVKHPAKFQIGSPGGYQPSAVFSSTDGSVLTVVSYGPRLTGMTDAQYAKAITIRTFDLAAGKKYRDVHPARSVWIQGMSPDGREVFGARNSNDPNKPPEFDVLRTSDGALLRSVTLEPGCCSNTIYDAANRQLYGLELQPGSFGSPDAKPAAPTLVSYDLSSGRQVGRLTLDGILAGSRLPSPNDTEYVFQTWDPAVALSPDGSQIAVLDGTSNRLDLVDTRAMKIARSMDVAKPQGLLDRLGAALGLVPSVASAKEWLGAQIQAQFSPDGRQLYVTGREGTIGADGKWTVDGLGLRVVDVSDGQIVATAFSGQSVTSVVPSPDRNALYAETTPPMGGAFTLYRLDAATHAVTAQRRFLQDDPQLFFLMKSSRAPATWAQSRPMAGRDPARTSRSRPMAMSRS